MDIPLHLTISEHLRDQIMGGLFQPGEQLPSEHQLMSTFEVSRITVRRAIANLINQGLVTSHQGKGVFVKEQRKTTYSLSSPMVFFEEDMARQGVTTSIQNLVFEPVIATQDVQQKLHLTAQETTVYLQKKLLLLNDIPVAIDVTYILVHLGKRYAKDLKRQMTFPTLERNGVSIARIAATLECTRSRYETSEHLDLLLGEPLLVYSYTAYTTGDRPIVCGEALSRGDRLSYSVDISKQPPLVTPNSAPGSSTGRSPIVGNP